MMSPKSSSSNSSDLDIFEKEALLEKGYEESLFSVHVIDSDEPDQRPRLVLKPHINCSLLRLPKLSWIRSSKCAWLAAGILAIILLCTTDLVPPYPVAAFQNAVTKSPHNWQSIDNLFIFGDSYTSTVLEDLEKEPPRLVKILGNGDNTYRRKPNWITFLTEVYNTTTYNAYNFAMGGSTVDSRVVKPYLAGSSLFDQMRDFFRWYGNQTSRAPWKSQDTLFIFWFGVNDIALTHGRSKELLTDHRRPPMPEIFESYGTLVGQLYNIGARNFLFLTCPPLDLSHNFRLDTAFKVQEKLDETTDVARFNARLYEMRDMLRQNYTDASTAVFDAHRFWERVIETPNEFPQTAEVTIPSAICKESKPQDMPVNGVYHNNTCQDGALIRQHMWTDMHATYPIHNATAAQVIKDCFGPGGPQHYCS